jgi:hypothetical protein
MTDDAHLPEGWRQIHLWTISLLVLLKDIEERFPGKPVTRDLVFENLQTVATGINPKTFAQCLGALTQGGYATLSHRHTIALTELGLRTAKEIDNALTQDDDEAEA